MKILSVITTINKLSILGAFSFPRTMLISIPISYELIRLAIPIHINDELIEILGNFILISFFLFRIFKIKNV